jgi:hypothetical protein
MLKSDAGCVGVSVETFHWLKTEKMPVTPSGIGTASKSKHYFWMP